MTDPLSKERDPGHQPKMIQDCDNDHPEQLKADHRLPDSHLFESILSVYFSKSPLFASSLAFSSSNFCLSNSICCCCNCNSADLDSRLSFLIPMTVVNTNPIKVMMDAEHEARVGRMAKIPEDGALTGPPGPGADTDKVKKKR